MPESPVSPKEVAGKVKEFQEMANKHVAEQADAAIDFVKKGQEQVKAAVTETVDKIEKNIEEKAE
jgi:maltose-binding protein MalE